MADEERTYSRHRSPGGGYTISYHGRRGVQRAVYAGLPGDLADVMLEALAKAGWAVKRAKKAEEETTNETV